MILQDDSTKKLAKSIHLGKPSWSVELELVAYREHRLSVCSS